MENRSNISVSVGCTIFSFEGKELKVLLSKRKITSEVHEWSLPGDFITEKEDIKLAPKRIIQEMGGIEDVFTEQVEVLGSVNRYPGERVIAVSYYALINSSSYKSLSYHNTVEQTKWFPIREIPKLALDHEEIFSGALKKLKRRIKGEPIGLNLLPPKFTLTNLQNLYEAILEEKLDIRNFRRKVFRLDFLEKLDEKEENVARKRAFLYRFNEKRYRKLLEDGFYFDL